MFLFEIWKTGHSPKAYLLGENLVDSFSDFPDLVPLGVAGLSLLILDFSGEADQEDPQDVAVLGFHVDVSLEGN